MRIINQRNKETLEPQFGLYVTEDDVKRLRKVIKKSPQRIVFIPLVEVTEAAKKLDEALINTIGREKWADALRSGKMPEKEQAEEKGK